MLAVIIFLIMKLAYTFFENEAVLFLLLPTNLAIETITSSIAAYDPQSGFFHESLNIVIDKSCSGFNFWILCFVMFAFTTVRFIKGNALKLMMFPAVLLISLVLTIFVNTSRILLATLTPEFFNEQFPWLHQAQGTLIYLTFLITFYLGLYYLLQKLPLSHEKLA